MTSTHSRTRPVSTMHDPYLQPTHVRSRSLSTVGTSSPASFQSNMAIVDGPAPSGNYYGVFLGEPPRGFPSSLSSGQASPITGNKSLGTSHGSAYGSSIISTDTRSKHAKHSSIAFPMNATHQEAIPQPRSRHVSITVAPKSSVRESQHQPTYYTIKADPSTQTRQITVITTPAPVSQPIAQPAALPPSALKRERRSTFTPSTSTVSDCLPASELRTACKFTIGMVSECFKKPSNQPLFSHLRKTDAILSRIFAMLLTMSKTANLLTNVDSVGLTQLFQEIQHLLHRALSSRPHNSNRSQELDTYHHRLLNYANRLDLTLKIAELETKVVTLTFEHNMSQEQTHQIYKNADDNDIDLRSSSSRRSASVREQQKELETMHRERVALRDQISNTKYELAKAKKDRDALLGTKTVRFL